MTRHRKRPGLFSTRPGISTFRGVGQNGNIAPHSLQGLSPAQAEILEFWHECRRRYLIQPRRINTQVDPDDFELPDGGAA